MYAFLTTYSMHCMSKTLVSLLSCVLLVVLYLYLFCICIVLVVYLYCVSQSPLAANEKTLHILPHSVAGESASNTSFPRLLLLLSHIFHCGYFSSSLSFSFKSFSVSLHYLLSQISIVIATYLHCVCIVFVLYYPVSPSG